MDYRELAIELLIKMQSFHKIKQKKHFSEVMQGETFVLYYIALHDGDVLPGEISTEMDVSSARVATALNNLERKGLIIRQIDKNNRRKILVSITPEGKKIAEERYSTLVEKTTTMLTALGEHDAKEYVRIMGRLIESKAPLSCNCK